ncbi:MAG: Golgi transport complex subunit 6 [Peltula sp. TS41687]|nr:MAG: Golgi transport complex subunit 6 [Peltula sp. TS41687]
MDSTSIPTPGDVAPRQSALSNKITHVLSTSYADLDIRDALDILDRRRFQNTSEARRQLRLDVQKEVIDCNGEIIKEFGQVAEQLRGIGIVISRLNAVYEGMQKHVAAAQRETGSVVKETNLLLSQKQDVDKKQRLLELITAHFSLPPEDFDALTSITERVDDQFFKALNKLKRIHEDCQLLLGSENQTLGLDIMEQSSSTLNKAFEKLYRWVQWEFKALNLENMQISSTIRRALRVLAERPTLFESCLGFLAKSREQMLSEAFLAALTGSFQSDERSHSKPIELSAHDPMRYVGDMLAWTHSATVSEREALEVLFISDGGELARGIQAGLESDPWSRSAGDDVQKFDGVRALNDLVNRSLFGVGGILRQRVEQVISSHDESTLAYRIANLINFYRSTFEKLLGKEATILGVLGALHKSALRQFRILMRERTMEIQADLRQAPADLNAPRFLMEALEQVQDLMKSYETSYSPASSQEADTEIIFKEALDPSMESCDSMHADLEEPSDGIFLLNCLIAVRNALTAFSFTTARVSKVDRRSHELVQKLIDHQHAFFLHTSGLHPLVVALAPFLEKADDLEAMAALPLLQPHALTRTSQTLDEFLSTAVLDATENLKLLQGSKLVHDITEEATSRFCKDFEFIEGRILAIDEHHSTEEEDEDSRVPLRSVFPRTSEEIRVLLS